MLEIDGSQGEGGGQMLRTALALAMVTQQPFRMKNIRHGRKQPGLKNQHLHCIKAFQMLSDAKADGARLGSEELMFIPAPFKRRTLKLDIGTAGSLTLMLQALLPPMIIDGKKFNIELTGGTDVCWSPPIDYVAELLVPHLRKYADIDLKTLQRGFHPKGGGKIALKVEGKFSADNRGIAPKIDLLHLGHLIHVKGRACASMDLQEAMVADRMADAATSVLKALDCPTNIQKTYDAALSTGCSITVYAIYSLDDDDINFTNPIRIGADTLGARGKKSEVVGEEAAKALLEELTYEAPVDEHLADNLIPYLGLFGGRFKAAKVSEHTKTNIAMTDLFLSTHIQINNRIISRP